MDKQEIIKLGKQVRKNIIKMIYNAESGHPGGSLSAVEIMIVLFKYCMKHSAENPKDQYRDRFILSKGHASPVYYAILHECGYISKEELETFRALGSRLQGHPANTYLDCIEVSTGSLGQGLSMGCGIAMSLKLDKNPSRVFVLIGDGELQEGNIWEALMQIPHRKLNNLTAIIDRNRLQIDGNTECIKPIDNLTKKLKAFNWNVIEIDGHDVNEIYSAIENSKLSDKPTAIIANTIKGKGISFMENNPSWHGKPPKWEEYILALKELE